jgi:hypothetical protein
MPSSKKVTANRRNAQRSTGPRTAVGKSRSRLNALKHGLAIPAAALPEFAPDVAQVAQAITAEAAETPTVREAAARVAEATTDVLRARRAKTVLLERLVRAAPFQLAPPTDASMLAAAARPRLSKGAHAQAILNGTEHQWLEAEFAAQTMRVEQRRLAKQRASGWDQLDKLDRYERRALSRRNTVIRAFDEVWAAAGYGSADHMTSFRQNEPKEGGNTQEGSTNPALIEAFERRPRVHT